MPRSGRPVFPGGRGGRWPPLAREAPLAPVALPATVARPGGAAADAVAGPAADTIGQGSAGGSAGDAAAGCADAGGVRAVSAEPAPGPAPDSSGPVLPFGRPSPAVRAAALGLVEMIGLPSICPLRECRRRRACADPDGAQLPFCLWQHRGTVRFVLALAAARFDLSPGRGVAAEGSDGEGATRRPRARGAETLLGRLAFIFAG